jgi:hypothetical protein
MALKASISVCNSSNANSNYADLKTEQIKNLMHPQMLEKTGGPINHIPTRAINIEMGLHDERTILDQCNRGIKLEVG